MTLPKHKTMIWMNKITVAKLVKLKLCKRESYDEIINRLLETREEK
ncbi:hypothetical protein KAJ87_01600 [Candidatus Pacearchaeota archaeon]|nr:hypothetical protein [Candidatus Pacearchaeota archaeon]